MLIGFPALGRQQSNKSFKDLNWQFDFGLLKEGRFLVPRISRTVYFLDLEYFFWKNVFCEICKIYIEKIDLDLLQEGRFLAISIFAALGLSEKRI